ncbi:MAG: DMT family transporter [Candidatus Zixiibacteriota bacterium]
MFEFWGELAALGTASSWALASMVFTLAGRRIGAFNLNKLRIPMAIVLLGTMLLITGQYVSWRDLSLPGYGWLALSGIVGLTLGDSAYFQSLVLVGPRRASLLMSSSPIMAALIAWPALGERLGTVAWLGIIVSVGGIAWVNAERIRDANNVKSRFDPRGIVLGLVGAAGQAIGLVIAKHVLVSNDIPPLFATFVRMLAAAVTIWAWAIAHRQVHSTLGVLRDRRAALTVCLGAVLGPFLGVWLSLVAVKHIEAGVAATIMAFFPVLILPVVAIVDKEKLSYRAVIGALVTVAGIAMLFLR